MAKPPAKESRKNKEKRESKKFKQVVERLKKAAALLPLLLQGNGLSPADIPQKYQNQTESLPTSTLAEDIARANAEIGTQQGPVLFQQIPTEDSNLQLSQTDATETLTAHARETNTLAGSADQLEYLREKQILSSQNGQWYLNDLALREDVSLRDKGEEVYKELLQKHSLPEINAHYRDKAEGYRDQINRVSQLTGPKGVDLSKYLDWGSGADEEFLPKMGVGITPVVLGVNYLQNLTDGYTFDESFRKLTNKFHELKSVERKINSLQELAAQTGIPYRLNYISAGDQIGAFATNSFPHLNEKGEVEITIRLNFLEGEMNETLTFHNEFDEAVQNYRDFYRLVEQGYSPEEALDWNVTKTEYLNPTTEYQMFTWVRDMVMDDLISQYDEEVAKGNEAWLAESVSGGSHRPFNALGAVEQEQVLSGILAKENSPQVFAYLLNNRFALFAHDLKDPDSILANAYGNNHITPEKAAYLQTQINELIADQNLPVQVTYDPTSPQIFIATPR